MQLRLLFALLLMTFMGIYSTWDLNICVSAGC